MGSKRDSDLALLERAATVSPDDDPEWWRTFIYRHLGLSKALRFELASWQEAIGIYPAVAQVIQERVWTSARYPLKYVQTTAIRIARKMGLLESGDASPTYSERKPGEADGDWAENQIQKVLDGRSRYWAPPDEVETLEQRVRRLTEQPYPTFVDWQRVYDQARLTSDVRDYIEARRLGKSYGYKPAEITRKRYERALPRIREAIKNPRFEADSE
ncbi:MAG: hypothetical protein FJW32_21445 [Acidobacteria bacterium]|nr:hypothetical protein [Acidobacteriota bacterium]